MSNQIDPVVIVGGGIAGVTCAKVLSLDDFSLPIILVSSSPIVKVVANIRTIGRSIDVFDVIEQNSSQIQSKNLKVMINQALELDSRKREIKLDNGQILKYSKLCICTGAKPKIVPFHDKKVEEFIKCLRDNENAKSFEHLLEMSKRIMIVGNGGIATELVYEVSKCQIIWAIRDKNFGATFFDAGAEKFFSDFLTQDKTINNNLSKRHHFTTEPTDTPQKEYGVALGPDWHSGLKMHGSNQKNVIIENCCEVSNIYSLRANIPLNKQAYILDDKDWNVFVELTNGKIYGCDMVISATGVIPNHEVFTRNNSFRIGMDGGIWVDDQLKTSVSDVYAAGDVCSAGWNIAEHWFQMRLWTQARQMGYYVAKCISSHFKQVSPLLHSNFEVFTHVTKFFGFRVILLGLYNGQKLKSNDYKILCRVVPQKEFIKVILQNDRMKGAILIGDTNFEETFEFLIYNQIDLSRFGDHLLDEVLDVEDFFD